MLQTAMCFVQALVIGGGVMIGSWVADIHEADITPQVAQVLVQDEGRLDKMLQEVPDVQRVFVKEMLKKRASQ